MSGFLDRLFFEFRMSMDLFPKAAVVALGVVVLLLIALPVVGSLSRRAGARSVRSGAAPVKPAPSAGLEARLDKLSARVESLFQECVSGFAAAQKNAGARYAWLDTQLPGKLDAVEKAGGQAAKAAADAAAALDAVVVELANVKSALITVGQQSAAGRRALLAPTPSPPLQKTAGGANGKGSSPTLGEHFTR